MCLLSLCLKKRAGRQHIVGERQVHSLSRSQAQPGDQGLPVALCVPGPANEGVSRHQQ